MIGVIAGEVIGSEYEVWRIKATKLALFIKKSSRFTDYTVLTTATEYAFMRNNFKEFSNN
jgi:hypothetical protein